jgi:hypothetical protein
LCFKTIADSEEAKAEVLQGLKQFLTEARIPASSEVLVRGQELVYDVISRSSRDADLVFLGMRSPTPDESVEDYSRYYEKLLAHTEDFPATALVIAGEKVDFKRIFMER